MDSFLGCVFAADLLMGIKKKRDFDPHAFLATIGEGRKVAPFEKKKTIFAQGDAADALFYIQSGKVKLRSCPTMERKQP